MSSEVNRPDLLTYSEAAALVAAYVATLQERPKRVEQVALGNAAGRILAAPVTADRDQPPFDRSTRDGYACRAADASAHGWLQLTGATRAGLAPAGELTEGTAWEIMTGAPVPAGADAVAMLEHVETCEGKVRLKPPRTLLAGENIVSRGAQGRAGETVLAAGCALGAGQIALAASCGCFELAVYARPRVAILATGDELVAIDALPGAGEIRNSNSPMLAAMVEKAGGEPRILSAARDSAEALDAALEEASDADLLLITGGVSAGKFDLVEPALARKGARFHFTGVRIQPGKPAVFGDVELRGDRERVLPFFGLPGNPVSSAVTFLLFAAPVLRAVGGSRESYPRFALAKVAPGAERGSKKGLTQFLPAICDFGGADANPLVAFVPWQGSGDLTALARANCFLVVPPESEMPEAGATVGILLY